MESKIRPINVLIIDDKSNFVQELQLQANPYCILFEHATNLEDGVKKFSEQGERRFAGIILDRDCYHDHEMKNRGNILAHGTRIFEKKTKLPIVVLTGEKEETQKEYSGLYQVFGKDTVDIDRMLKYFKEKSVMLDHIRYANEHTEVFRAIENHFSKAAQKDVFEDLVFVLKRLVSNNEVELKAGLHKIRCIIETVLFSINQFDNAIIPNDKVMRFRNNKWEPEVQFSDTMRHLTTTGKLNQNNIIEKAFWNVWVTASNYGSHPDLKKMYFDSRDHLTNYTYRAVVYQTLDILLWCRDVRECKR